MRYIIFILLFSALMFSQTVQINQGAQSSSAQQRTGAGVTSINGDVSADHTIKGDIGNEAVTTGGTTTIHGSVINAVYDCGLKGDGKTDDSAALQACLDAHKGRVIFLPIRSAPVPAGYRPKIDYWMGSTTIHLHGNGTALIGEEIGTKWIAGTALFWNYNTMGIELDADCQGCVLKNLYLSGPDLDGTKVGMAGFTSHGMQCWNSYDSADSGFFGNFHGIYAIGGEPRLQNINVQCFNGNGIYIRGNLGSQPDLWQAETVAAFDNHGNGMLVEGCDANNGHEQAGNFFGNQLWGIWDNACLSNTYITNHTNVNFHVAFTSGGLNHRSIIAIARVSNVVTACFVPGTAGPTQNAAGFGVNNPLYVWIANNTAITPDPNSLSSGTAPVLVTNVSAATAACPIAGSGGGAGGYVQWNSTGPDVTWNTTTAAGFLGIASTISSVDRTGNTVHITASAPTSTATASDIDKIGRWVKIVGTGTELDNHIFRPTAVAPTAGSTTVNLSFNYLGPDIAAVHTGYVYSAGATDILDPNQTIRTVMDAKLCYPASTTCYAQNLNSETAQFPANIFLSGPGKTGQPIRIQGAGPGGSTLNTTVKQNAAYYSTTVQLATLPSQAVTNVEADFGGSFEGGGYQSTEHATPSVWINPYYEAVQGTHPLRFSNNTIVVPGNISPQALDLSLGTPLFLSNSVIMGQGGTQFMSGTSPVNWGFRGGVAGSVLGSQTLLFQDPAGALRYELFHDWGLAGGYTGTGLSIADNQINFGISNLSIRLLDPAINGNPTRTYPPTSQYINIGNGNPSNFRYYGSCGAVTPLTPTSVFTMMADTGNITLHHPCTTSATNVVNYSSPSFTFYNTYWNTTSTTAATSGWVLQNTLPGATTSATPTISTFSIHPYLTGLAVNNVSEPTVTLDSLTFTQLTTLKTNNVPAGTEAFCNNCVPATPASCSTATPASCKCVQGTGTMIAKYENFVNAGADWYCH